MKKKKIISSIAQSLKEISPKNRTIYYNNLEKIIRLCSIYIKLTNKNQVIEQIRKRCKKIDTIQEIFNEFFKFKLTRYNNKYISLN